MRTDANPVQRAVILSCAMIAALGYGTRNGFIRLAIIVHPEFLLPVDLNSVCADCRASILFAAAAESSAAAASPDSGAASLFSCFASLVLLASGFASAVRL